MNDKLIEELRNAEEVEALVLGGSRATGNYDESSDYDYYVYLNKPFSEDKRRMIIEKYVKYMEFSNTFWELEDDGTFKNGIDVEFIYRKLDDIDEMLENTLIKRNMGMGYSTCFVDNLLNSKIIFDKENRVMRLREKYRKTLNKELYSQIINNNWPVMLDKMPSMYYQIQKAMKRKDVLSINHRTTAFFELYFDIIFAVNETTHPGEKRMLEIALKLDKLPSGMKKDIDMYFENMLIVSEKSLVILERIVIALHQLLTKEGHVLTYRSYK